MKKNILYIALLGVMSLMTVSCSSELDIEKHGNMGSMDTYYTTDENINSASASLYLSVRSNYFTWYFLKNLLSDDVWCGGGQRGDNGEMEKLNEYNFDTNHGSIEGVYSGLYSIIYKANLIIDMTEGETAVMKRAINEAKVFRAWAHFELVSLWGTAPKVDHLLDPSEYRQANSTAADTWAFVEQDLTEAIASGTLPSKSGVDDQETGIRVTKEFAQALLGKAYLFQGKYSEAASMLDNVINSGKYALFTGEYDAQFHAAANNNCESVFELQKRYDTEQMWTQFDMTFLMQGWRSDKLKYKGDASKLLATGTYGFCNPRKSLYDAFVAWEGTDGYRLNKTILTYQQLNDFGVTISGSNAVYGDEGYFYWKNQSLKEDCVVDQTFFQGMQFINLKIMRYAEVLLMAAEAQLQAGNSSKALQYINEIRTRAKETPLTTVTLNDIKTEKRLELCLECVRYQDLVRWGDAKTAMAEQGKQVPAFTTDGVQWNWQNTVYGFQDKNNLLPIPLKELELNPNMQQNPGW
ncbi:MAG: RagB/SusD family nutrient uptake outer membrane protein [Prevotella sp.]|nr:RagB/SusD family nutrient uptake outer membrane protein [Prevotella sp.]